VNCALISCTTQKHTSNHITHHRDSAYIEQLTPHLIPPDSTTINALLRCDSLGQVYISQIDLLCEHNNTLSLSLDSLGNLQQTIIHHHDTLWLPHSETKTTEKTDFLTETRQIEYKTPPFIKKIITGETIIITVALLFYLVKKRIKQ
jgi:hypothetical protein